MAKKKPVTSSADVNAVSGERLLAYVERIELLEAEKKDITDAIKDVKAEARNFGFDVPTINAIVKLRKLSQQQREEQEALLDIYKAALGMLFDTPLGEAARRRLAKPKDDADDQDDESAPDEPEDARADPFAGVSIDDARAQGREAAQQGVAVTKNPFPAGDARRAAWDEAWCAALGTDGMDIPEAFRRKPAEKPKKDDDEGGDT